MSGESWQVHVVRQGEYLRKLAYRFGVAPEELWDHPKNADLKATPFKVFTRPRFLREFGQ
jgi:hypothetical protein